MPQDNSNRLYCWHVEHQKARIDNTIPLPDSTYFSVCENCSTALRARLLESLINNALTEVFRESVQIEGGL